MYSVVSTGQLRSSHENVKSNLAKIFKVSDDRAKLLLKKGSVLKASTTQAHAEKLVAAAKRAGLHCVSVPVKEKKPTEITVESVLPDKLPKLKPSLAYRFQVVLLLIASVISPVIYLAFLGALVSGLVYWMLSFNQVMSLSRNILNNIMLFGVLIFIMGVLIIFVVRPLFVHYPRYKAEPISEKDFPLFVSMVNGLCERLNVPAPKQIFLDNQVNASAGPVNGLMDILRGRMALTLGLPLVYGSTSTQLLGTLAHEFGHFSQRLAFVATFLNWSVNHWFEDRGYRADPLEEQIGNWLDDASEDKENNLFIWIVFLITRYLILATRYFFQGLFQVNLRLTQAMSRAMEFDADKYECLIAGSDAFEANSIRLRSLGYASQKVAEMNNLAWQENRLLENLPAAIAFVADNHDEEFLQRIQEDMKRTETNFWDSHPADFDRIKQAKSLNFKKQLKQDFHASKLFTKLDKYARTETLDIYRYQKISNPKKLVTDNSEILGLDKHKKKAQQALETYFNTAFSYRFLTLSGPLPSDITGLNLTQTIDRIRELHFDYKTLNQSIYDGIGRKNELAAAEAFKTLGYTLDVNAYKIKEDSKEAINLAGQETNNKLRELMEKTIQVDHLFFHRMRLGFTLLDNPKKLKLKKHLKALNQIKSIEDSCRKLSRAAYVFECVSNLEVDEPSQSLLTEINYRARTCFELSIKLFQNIKEFESGLQDVNSLEEFILTWTQKLPDSFPENDPMRAYTIARNISNAIQYTYYWNMADLCAMLLEAELNKGIRQLKYINIKANEMALA